jgi:AraC-like DNA-binding protein
MSDIKTSAIVLPNTINTALRLGVDIQDILRQLGISIDLAHITQSIIDLKQIHAIVSAVEKASGHPAIGLLSGEDFDFDYLPNLKAFIMSARTLREVFESSRPMQKLITPLLILNMEDAEKVTSIKLKPDIALCEEDERHYTEMVFACVKSLTNRIMRKTVAPQAVHFRHGKSEITPLYADFFGCIIVLNAPENAIIYDRAIMDIPLPGRFTEIRQQAGNILNQQMADSLLQCGLAEDLKRLLTAHGDLFHAPIDQVARSLHMSTRTLQRRMAAGGHSLADVRDQVRFQLAADALQSRRLSIEEIGAQLGFSDRHSFTRAFKRWTGLTPSAYRKNPSI